MMHPDELETRARAGEPAACLALGRKLLRGRGIGRDYERAIALFDTAARTGHPDALYLLGKCYLKGIGCTKDPAGGVSCLEAAANAGHAAAARRLGDCFAQGLGAPRNSEMASYWYRKAAARGDTRAYDQLLRLAEKEGF